MILFFIYFRPFPSDMVKIIFFAFFASFNFKNPFILFLRGGRKCENSYKNFFLKFSKNTNAKKIAS